MRKIWNRVMDGTRLFVTSIEVNRLRQAPSCTHLLRPSPTVSFTSNNNSNSNQIVTLLPAAPRCGGRRWGGGVRCDLIMYTNDELISSCSSSQTKYHEIHHCFSVLLIKSIPGLYNMIVSILIVSSQYIFLFHKLHQSLESS